MRRPVFGLLCSLPRSAAGRGLQVIRRSAGRISCQLRAARERARTASGLQRARSRRAPPIWRCCQPRATAPRFSRRVLRIAPCGTGARAAAAIEYRRDHAGRRRRCLGRGSVV